MDIKKIGLVISHEYSVRVRKKSFILTTILTPLLLGLLICVPTAIMLLGGNEHQVVEIIDNSSLVKPYFQDDGGAQFVFADQGTTFEQIRDSIGKNDLYAVVVVSAVDSEGNVSVDAYSKEPLSAEIRTTVKRAVNKAVEDNKLVKYNITDLDEILAQVKTDIKVNSMTLTESGKAKEDTVEIYMILAYLMSFLIYMFVFMFGSMVMRSVIDEKSSRVVEVIVSSVRSTELMMGKIIGVALVALTQFLIWVGLTVAIAVGVSSVASEKIIEKAGGADAIVAQMAASGVQVDAGSLDLATIIQASGKGEDDDVAGVVRQITTIPWAYIVLCFLAYFILGYLLYAAMFAAIGAAVDNESDTSQLQLPVTIPLIIGLFIMLHTFEHPSSQLSFWASIIPWTSPMVMLARIPFGFSVVPSWQLILSLVLLALTFLATAWLSARIYRIGILTYGKKTSFKDLFKWLKQRD